MRLETTRPGRWSARFGCSCPTPWARTNGISVPPFGRLDHNGCGNTSPTRLLTGDAPERRMVADRFQSICSMVNTVNKRPGSGTPRERQPSEQICAWAPSQRIEARRPPMTRMSLASYRRAELGASVLRFQRSRLKPLEGTGSIGAAGTGARALQLPALPRRWLWRRSTTDQAALRGGPNVAQPADQWVPTGDGRRRASAAEGARGRSDAR